MINRFQPTQLDEIHIDALLRVSKLSMIPMQIRKEFGSYDRFSRALGSRDMAGIDYAEFTPTGIMYNGGLNEFVRALEAEKVDTSLHALKDSLDPRDHFAKLSDTLEQLPTK